MVIFSAGDAAFCAAVGFLTGILAAGFSWNFYLIAALSLLAAFFAYLLSGAIKTPAIFAAIFLAAVVSGTVYYNYYLARRAAEENLPFGKSISFSAIVSDEPQNTGQYLLLTATAEKPYAGTVTIFAGPDAVFQYGDELAVQGSISRPKASNEGPAIFPKRLSLAARHKAFWLRETLIDFKLAILEKFNMLLPQDEATLLGGIAFGSKASFGADLKSAMAASGTTHLVAISGYNITIVIIAAEAALGGLLSRRKKFYATALLISFFVLMTGLQASAIRAALMGFLALAAKASGKIFSMRNAIALTAAAMAAFDPTILAQNVGFELSFLSLLGIVYLSDPMKKLFHCEEKGALDWKENAVTTASAQLGVMPVLIGVFGQFSATAIFANILVLGTVPLTMFLGFALAAASLVSYYLAFFIAEIVGLLLAYQLWVIRLFAALAVPLPFHFDSIATFIAYYASLAWFARRYA